MKFCKRSQRKSEKVYEQYQSKFGKGALYFAILMLLLAPITGTIVKKSYQKSADEIGGNFKILSARVMDKTTARPIRGSQQYYIYGKTADGHEEYYQVNQDLYDSLNNQDEFTAFNYKRCYGISKKDVIKANAGTLYSVIAFVFIMNVTLGIGMIFVYLFDFRKGNKMRKKKKGHVHDFTGKSF